jgi:hypothetical protein
VLTTFGSDDQLIRMSWAVHFSLMGEKRNSCRAWLGKPEGKRPLGRPRHRWDDTTKVDIKEIGMRGENLSES